ncbi:hypothetical protein HK100_007473 [Physocladia obscura]|uniref:Ribosome recycling factor domain-containing protein n=1 Tax=Physocladia obscura TaxID=109957 RepID=A0AAD5XB47_9FUNG|nr:hypothetical protein HK100_007473 [Physocladia obscura]
MILLFASTIQQLNKLRFLQPILPHSLSSLAFVHIRTAQLRFYATKKNNKSSKTSKENDDDEAPKEYDLAKMIAQLRTSVDRLKESLSTSVSIKRANPALLDKIIVQQNRKAGVKTAGISLLEIAQISAKDAHTLMVVLNDEDLVCAAEKSIRDANLGFSPQKVDSSTLKVVIPKMSAERRDELLKSISQITEKHRIALRDIRTKALADVKKLKIKSEDEVRKLEKKIQTEQDNFMKEINNVSEAKKKEISGI